MSVHSICPVRLPFAITGRHLNFCLILVGLPCNPFLFLRTHIPWAYVRSFLGQITLKKNPALAGVCACKAGFRHSPSSQVFQITTKS